ncbi:MAG: tetratricopeptide repeat protein [Methanomicrobiales archaeon]|nr:tetratricopeptide repeat protein [Methanomicrobiales archaeon]
MRFLKEIRDRIAKDSRRSEVDRYLKEGYDLNYEGKYEEAVIRFVHVISLDPESEKAYLGLGWSLLKLERYSEALWCFERAIERNPWAIYNYYYKGNCLTALSRFEDAIMCYKKVLEIDPSLSEAWMNMALCHKKLGDHERSEKCMEEAARARGEDDLKRLLGN